MVLRSRGLNNGEGESFFLSDFDFLGMGKCSGICVIPEIGEENKDLPSDLPSHTRLAILGGFLSRIVRFRFTG